MKYFSFIRKTGYTNKERTIASYDSFYSKDSEAIQITRAAGLDNEYGNSDEDIYQGLKRAKDNNEVIFFYSHKVDDKDPYATPYERFEKIIKMAEDLGLEFYTCRDLAG